MEQFKNIFIDDVQTLKRDNLAIADSLDDLSD